MKGYRIKEYRNEMLAAWGYILLLTNSSDGTSLMYID